MDDLRDLIDQVRTAEGIASLLRRDLQRAQEENKRLRAEVEEARSGLLILEPCVRHYADPANWDGSCYDGEPSEPDAVAREALERLEETRRGPVGDGLTDDTEAIRQGGRVRRGETLRTTESPAR